MAPAPSRRGFPGQALGNEPRSEIHVFPVLERLVDVMFPNFVVAYDFAGSFMDRACESRCPDKDLSLEEWRDREKITQTQWFMYWVGLNMGCLRSLLLTARPLDRYVPATVLRPSPSPEVRASAGKKFFPPGTKTLVLATVQGGPMSQAEKQFIPTLIKGTLSDLASRSVSSTSEASNYIYWIHFDSVSDLIRALQGYGSVDLCVPGSWEFGEPIRWSADAEDDYDPESDLLTQTTLNMPVMTRPEQRLDYLLWAPAASGLSRRLVNAVNAQDAELVKDLLDIERLDPTKARDREGRSALHLAIWNADPEMVRLLVEGGADTKDAGDEFSDILSPEKLLDTLPVYNTARGQLIREELREILLRGKSTQGAEIRKCPTGCGRPVAISRSDGEAYESCCRTCLRTKGEKHGPRCEIMARRRERAFREKLLHNLDEQGRKASQQRTSTPEEIVESLQRIID